MEAIPVMAGQTITIRTTDSNEVNLIDILLAVKPFISVFEWEINVECSLAPSGRVLEGAKGLPRSTAELLEMSSRPYLQVIEGKLIGRSPTDTLIISAVDGQWWDIETASKEIQRSLLLAFPTATSRT